MSDKELQCNIEKKIKDMYAKARAMEKKTTPRKKKRK